MKEIKRTTRQSVRLNPQLAAHSGFRSTLDKKSPAEAGLDRQLLGRKKRLSNYRTALETDKHGFAEPLGCRDLHGGQAAAVGLTAEDRLGIGINGTAWNICSTRDRPIETHITLRPG